MADTDELVEPRRDLPPTSDALGIAGERERADALRNEQRGTLSVSTVHRQRFRPSFLLASE